MFRFRAASLFSKEILHKRFSHTMRVPKVFVGHHDKVHFSLDSNQEMEIKFSFGRGIFSLNINKGRINAEGVDITDSLPKKIIEADEFKLFINKGVKINGFDITDIIINKKVERDKDRACSS
jgi:hypothetical protein